MQQDRESSAFDRVINRIAPPAIVLFSMYAWGKFAGTLNHDAFIFLLAMTLLSILLLNKCSDRFDEVKKPPNYQCSFRLKVIKPNGDIINFIPKYKITTPIQPYLGLIYSLNLNPPDYISADDEKHDSKFFYSGRIDEVIWRGDLFACTVQSDKIDNMNMLGKAIRGWERAGWEPVYGYKPDEEEALKKWMEYTRE